MKTIDSLDTAPLDVIARCRTVRSAAIVLGLAGPLCLLGGLLHPIVDGHAHSHATLATDHLVGSLVLLAGTIALVIGLPAVVPTLAPALGRLGAAAPRSTWSGTCSPRSRT